LADNFLHEEHFTVILRPETASDRRTAFTGFLLENIQSLRRTNSEYLEILFVDLAGQVIISTDASRVGLDLAARPDVAGTLNSPSGGFIRDVHQDPDTGRPEMAFGFVLHAVDLAAEESTQEVNGAIVLRVDLNQTLFPLIGAWPGMGDSGETLLVRRDGEQTLFLNPLRFDAYASLTRSVAAGSEDALPAQLAAAGEEGIVRTTDYRGEQVLAAYRWIAEAGWGFVAKQDAVEAFSPVVALTLQWVIVTLLVLSGAAVVAIYMARALSKPLVQLAEESQAAATSGSGGITVLPGGDEIAQVSRAFRASLVDLEEQRRDLEASEYQFRTLLDSAGQGVVVSDAAGQVVLVNIKAEDMFGYARGELVGQPVEILVPDARRGVHRSLRDRYMQHPQVRPMGHGLVLAGRCKDGSELPLEISLSYIETDAGVLVMSLVSDVSEREHDAAQIRMQMKRIGALREIDTAITSSLDRSVVLNVILDQTVEQLRVEAAAILLLDQQTQVLTFGAGRGFRTDALKHTELRLGEGYAGAAAQERRLVSAVNIGEAKGGFQRAPLMADEDFTTYHAAPLIAKGQVKGVLEVFHRNEVAPDKDWSDFLQTLSGQAAIAIDSAGLFDELQHSNAELFAAYDTTLEGWSRALDLRDKETEGHTQRVTAMMLTLAGAMGFRQSELSHVRRGALLHDIGKMGIPDAILLKPGPLTDEEWEIMRRHPTYALELLSPISYLSGAMDIPYCHHEKWDGTGYPRGLQGDVIPLAARLFAAVDIWDALCSDRPYRAGWPVDKVRGTSSRSAAPTSIPLWWRRSCHS
jgi:PAS domain S-box-containing protein